MSDINKIIIKYSEARKKYIKFFVMWAVLLIVLISMSFLKVFPIFGTALVFTCFGALLLWKIRKIGNELNCSNCGTVLASEIGSLKQRKLSLAYCPICGKAIEVT